MLNSNMAFTPVFTNLTPNSSSSLFLLRLLPCLPVSQGLPWSPLYFSTLCISHPMLAAGMKWSSLAQSL